MIQPSYFSGEGAALKYIICCFSFLIVYFSPVIAAEKMDVYYGGVSFIGNFADNKRLYEHSFALSEEKNAEGLPVLEQALLARVKKINRDDINFVVGGLGNIDTGSAITLAFGVDWENISIENIAGIYKIVVDLHAQILIFDYNSQKIIGSYPVALQVRDVSETEPSAELIRSIIRSLYLNDEYGMNIFETFAERLKEVPIQASFGQYLRVNNVILEEKSLPFIPTGNQGAFKTLVAQSFGKYLSTNQNVSLLPYTKGEAIGSKMALRFSNGDIFNLITPSSDYGIDLIIRGFKKVKAGENHAKVSWVYGSYVRIKVEQPDTNKLYMDIPFVNAAVKEVPISQSSVDDWSAYQESLFSFFDQFSREISKPSKKWLGKVTKVKNASKQLKAFNNILNKSR